MTVPFRFRKIPAYVFDGDGRFGDAKIVGRDKRMMRKKQIKHFLKMTDKDWS